MACCCTIHVCWTERLLSEFVDSAAMYCFQSWLPLLMLPQPSLQTPVQQVFIVLLVMSIWIDYRPCVACAVIILLSVAFTCFGTLDPSVRFPDLIRR
jgi:hypothetical protein